MRLRAWANRHASASVTSALSSRGLDPVARERPGRLSAQSEVLVHRPYGRRAFADRGRDPLRRSGAHVADREQTRMARLVREGLPLEICPPFVEVLGLEGRSVSTKPWLVERGAARQPSVAGSAPMNENSATHGSGVVAAAGSASARR